MDGVDILVPRGTIVGIVGESGCGKSVTAMSIMHLVQKPGRVIEGQILLDGEDLVPKTIKEMNKIRGDRISMIFQEPMTSLNPVYTIGKQVSEAILLHQKVSKEAAKERTIEIFRQVGIPEPEKRYNAYPHQLSGGLRQRVMIGMAMVCNPDLMIADEPTTALDVTIQAQVLDLIKELRVKRGTSLILITHDLGVVADTCDKVAVVYAGEIVEVGTLEDVFDHPTHPYTKGLFDAIPDMNKDVDRLSPIEGLPPNPIELPKGCYFAARCPYATDSCREEHGELKHITDTHLVRCIKKEQEG